MKKFTLLLAFPFFFALHGCNTVKGVGQDLQKAGEALEDAVKKK